MRIKWPWHVQLCERMAYKVLGGTEMNRKEDQRIDGRIIFKWI
jgi:hypothetical protein